MSISYNEDGALLSPAQQRRLKFLVGFNAGFALLVVFGWTLVAPSIAAAWGWATDAHVARGTGLEILRYPFALLWGLPCLGIGGSWLARKSQQNTLAFACALAPVAFMSMVFGWYYIFPSAWH